jgi:hypothetical protein
MGIRADQSTFTSEGFEAKSVVVNFRPAGGGAALSLNSKLESTKRVFEFYRAAVIRDVRMGKTTFFQLRPSKT